MRLLSIFSFLLIFSFSIFGQSKEAGLNAITETTVKAQLDFLASDWMEGRETGTRGAYMAADYITSLFKIYGLQPAGDIKTITPSWREMRAGAHPQEIETYFQNFSLLEYDAGEEQLLSITSKNNGVDEKINFRYKTDFDVRPSSIGMEAEAPVVFVGYGYKNEEHGYNDYKNVDVKGKIVLRLAGYPGHQDTSSKGYDLFDPKSRWGRWIIARDKNNFAEEAGAIAVLEVDLNKDNAIDWASNYPFRYNTDYYEGTERISSGIRKRMTVPGDSLSSSLTVFTITQRVANLLLKESKIDLNEFEIKTASNLKPSSKNLNTKTVHIKTTVESNIVRARNVLAKIEGENPNEIIVVGAHYDHVGMNMDYIWNGADDNASGTVGMMTLAKAFAESGVKPKRTIIFAGWTGEEKGLLGSKYFADNFIKDNDDQKIVLNLNYDMISRDDDDDSLGVKCRMTYTEIDTTAPLKILAEKINDELDLGLEISFNGSKQPGGGSDHSSFSSHGIPVFYFMAGFPPEYHRPADHSDLANIEKMTKIIKLGYKMIAEFAYSTDPINP
ncbi:MAG: M20/M25/M40 family metallo-hydrolase [Melioribacteraceae bacterium]|nr:M20/M25/M40 family metallo-hydrolase [Melioribacteraceae bacterium]